MQQDQQEIAVLVLSLFFHFLTGTICLIGSTNSWWKIAWSSMVLKVKTFWSKSAWMYRWPMARWLCCIKTISAGGAESKSFTWRPLLGVGAASFSKSSHWQTSASLAQKIPTHHLYHVSVFAAKGESIARAICQSSWPSLRGQCHLCCIVSKRPWEGLPCGCTWIAKAWLAKTWIVKITLHNELLDTILFFLAVSMVLKRASRVNITELPGTVKS